MQERKVTTKTLLAYGSGDIYGGGSFLIISTLFIFFLSNVVGLSPAMAGFIVFAGKAWDAISDPLFGCISDRTRSRFGRRRVFFLIGIVPVGLSFFLLWISVRFDHTFLTAAYYFFAYLFFCTVFTSVMVPYNALVTEISTDYRTRTRLSGAKMLFSQFSALIAGTVPGFIVNNLYKHDQAKGFFLVGLYFGIFYALPWILVFKGTWELEEKTESQYHSVKDSFKNLSSLMKNRTYKIHITMYLLAYTAMDIMSAAFIYFVTYYFGRPEIYIFCLGSMLLSQILFLPLYLYLANKIGKGKSYTIGAIILSIAMCSFLFIPSDVTRLFLIILSCIMGVGFSAIIAMPWAMLPESSDVDELLNGEARSGAVAGMFTLIRKLTQAFVLWLFGTLLSLIGFNAALPQQTGSTITGIRLIFCIAPLVCMIVATIVSLRYPVTPKTFKMVRDELDRLHCGGLREHADKETKKLCENLTGHAYR
ncbi:glycoside-pentoside-hexuronide (GPH):cation symporter [uncultured Sphaerochaeta sp.]|uniref:MFS transporter n=1 Tax=uncultured Sphaerochaeta sp. TaxID=886478 RepID=UPI0029CA32CD|nr:glycoside-pentoside-hexuronide (GPH):cation symporter [uncultured Sphaerochaeta sp.]